LEDFLASRTGAILSGRTEDAIPSRDEGDGYSYLPWVDLICAGVPCQDVSIAGKRAGLAGERTVLVYEFARILKELRPTWFLFENVPGLLSSNEGRDFAEVQRLFMVECGYGICWRVLDSQFFGVAQRRRRLFVVGRFGKPCPAEVLFERGSGERNPETGGRCGEDVAYTLRANPSHSGDKGDGGINTTLICLESGQANAGIGYDQSPSLTCLHEAPIVFGANDDGRDVSYDISPTIRCGGIGGGGVHTAVCFAQNQRGELRTSSLSPQLTCGGGKPGEGYPAVLIPDSQHQERSRELVHSAREMDGAMRGNVNDGTATHANGVRSFAGLPEGMDSARYRALGNAVTKTVAEWIANRILAANGGGD
jgi:DNA (cytosine-5)-methyltransferase 1